MRPPMPATTIEFESPNACNICHVEEDASWSNTHVVEWHGDYQDETLKYARLIFQGRNNDFTHIDQMCAMINNPNINLIFRNSIIRILASQTNEENEHYFFTALHDHSPLIRASAAEGLAFRMNEEAKKALLIASQDSVLIVRNRASSSLASYPKSMFTQEEWNTVEHNFREYEDFLMANPDSWSAHYNLGTYYQGRGMHQQAIKSYDKAVELEADAIMPLVNSAMAYSILGNNLQAEEKLKAALDVDPENSAANLNYGLLLAQSQRFDQAKMHLKRALNSDSTLSVAAYNLAVISSQSSLPEALKYISMAHELDPNNAKYGYTFAFYSYQYGKHQTAISTLLEVIVAFPDYIDAYLFLGNIYEETKQTKEAIGIYERATKIENIPAEYRQNIQMRANSLK